jgi:HSP20 family protein
MSLPARIDEWLRPLAFRSRMDELWPELWSGKLADRLPEVFGKDFVPPINLAETEKSVVVTLEAPGLSEGDFDINVTGNQLTITGEKKFEEKTDGKDFRRVERQYGQFSRSLTLPTAVRSDEVDAVYSKGVLTVSIPKLEPTPTKKVKVRAK